MKLKVPARLDNGFAPMALVIREMAEATGENGQDIVVAVERNHGYTKVYKTRIYKDGTGHDEENFAFIERIAKTLLWVSGGYKLHIAGSPLVAEYIKKTFSHGGKRDFDVCFMDVYFYSQYQGYDPCRFDCRCCDRIILHHSAIFLYLCAEIFDRL